MAEHVTKQWEAQFRPLLTVESAAALIQRSHVAAGTAINRLVDAGVLVQRNLGKQRYRVFEAPGVLRPVHLSRAGTCKPNRRYRHRRTSAARAATRHVSQCWLRIELAVHLLT